MSILTYPDPFYRMEQKLLLGWGDLRTRLPQAYDEGFAHFDETELREHDLEAEIAALRNTMAIDCPVGESAAERSIAAMTDEDVTKTASRFADLLYRINNRIEYLKKEAQQ